MASNTTSIEEIAALSRISANLPSSVSDVIDRYLHLHVGAHVLPCPYWRNRVGVRGLIDGKGTPSEIETEASSQALARGIDLSILSFQEVVTFMHQIKLGVDCSGFAFQLLDAFDKAKNHPGLESQITPTPGGNPLKQKRFRTNADYLTNHHNARPITAYMDIQPGDLIRFDGGKHLMVIVDVLDSLITYIHSSRKYTTITGVHYGQITLVQPSQSLESQTWQEQTHDNQSLGQQYFHTSVGDGIFRLNWW